MLSPGIPFTQYDVEFDVQLFSNIDPQSPVYGDGRISGAALSGCQRLGRSCRTHAPSSTLAICPRAALVVSISRCCSRFEAAVGALRVLDLRLAESLLARRLLTHDTDHQR